MLSQERCDFANGLLPVVPLAFAGTVEFEGEARFFWQAGYMLRKIPLLCASVKCLDLPWTWQEILRRGDVPQVLQACPQVKSILCLHLELHASPGFNDLKFLTIRVHRPSRNDPGAGIKACKKMLQEMLVARWLRRGQGHMRVHVTATAEFSSQVKQDVFQL